MNGNGVKAIIEAARAGEQLAQPVAIEKPGFHELFVPKRNSAGDMEYERVALPFAPQLAPQLTLHTLTGLVAYLSNNVDGHQKPRLMVHVVNETKVVLIEAIAGVVGGIPKRPYVAEVVFAPLIGGEAFKFGQYMDPESFNVALQTLFIEDEARAAVLQIAGTVREEKTEAYTDDGVTQGVVAASGRTMGKLAPIPNPVTLRPFRTFREVEQPASKFVLRARGGGEGKPPTLALFEADGGAWKLTAIREICAFLANAITDVALIA